VNVVVIDGSERTPTRILAMLLIIIVIINIVIRLSLFYLQ